MNQIHTYFSINENIYNRFHFTKCGQFCEYIDTLAKSRVSRGKLNYLLANDSTPLNRAFFVRNIRTPQEYADFVFNLIQNPIILSMVERNGQRLDVGCFPVKAVFHPVTFYRPTVESHAVVPENLLLELTQMYQFIFAAIRRSDLTNRIQKIRITANTERDARAQCAREFVLVLSGRINLQNTPKIDRTFNEMEVAHG